MTFPFNKLIPISNEEIVHSEEFYEEIRKYGSFLSDKKLPIIYSLPHLCLLSGVNINNIKKLCGSNRIDDYKRFKLKKRRGGFRVIQTPNEELKYLQRWILFNILDKITVHDSCTGFEKEKSIKQNAEIHLKSEAVLKIDLMRFFDTINEKRIYGLFKNFGYHKNLAVSFAKICTIEPNEKFMKSFKKNEIGIKNFIIENEEGILPQGSPTSPKLSNLVAFKLDKRLYGLALKSKLNYSRYADDITFSGNLDTLKKIKSIIYKIINEERFFVNHSKTKLLIRGNPFFVTGLSVNNNYVTIPKKRKIDIEHHLFHCLENGVEEHMKICEIKKRNFKDWLLGNIAFVYSVEKELGQKYFDSFNKIQWPI
ncbi:reverse transcriptase family protein [Flavobacterium soyangense]|uniref:RNA-directed DNA polymerase n=1 Tax=Flavobacterium soyangense TaxID=2023265 RepID=A0A930UAT9_9FLAO|nr:reverse transcriptase family protein [Flavobacterium soyangense]MBF2707442.1 RNA-directed DNA polymerase [Flavobacterium soyangense]